jgi:hypothetical protein
MIYSCDISCLLAITAQASPLLEADAAIPAARQKFPPLWQRHHLLGDQKPH